MKKNYKQPSVEATQLQLSTIVLAGSPAAGIGSGGNSNELGGGGPLYSD